MRKYYDFIMNDYQKYFFQDGNVEWYEKTIKALIDSATYFEEQKKIEDNEPIYMKLNKIDNREIAPVFAIENQIGLILVLCQTYQTNIINKVRCFYKDYEYFSEQKASAIPHKKQDLLNSYGKIITGAKYRNIQFIDALSNYYKHHDEWGDDKNRQNARTKEILEYFKLDIDMNIYWAQNMTNGLKVLGIETVTESLLLLSMINDWKKEIGKSIVELNVSINKN